MKKPPFEQAVLDLLELDESKSSTGYTRAIERITAGFSDESKRSLLDYARYLRHVEGKPRS